MKTTKGAARRGGSKVAKVAKGSGAAMGPKYHRTKTHKKGPKER